MNYSVFSFRHADVILREPEFSADYQDIISIINGVTDNDIIGKHNSYPANGYRLPKSISVAINDLLKERFINNGWNPESPIFQDPNYDDERWRLDFARGTISVEVAFNHSGTIAWNLIKPVLASELNHVRKAIQTKIGVIITATNAMRAAGGFDGAIGTFETFQNHLPPLNNLLTVPLLIIGLKPPTSFIIQHQTINGKKVGNITMLPQVANPPI